MADDLDKINARLHMLRRLYHHVINGGKTNEYDTQLIGAEPTQDNIAHTIELLEKKQSDAYAQIKP
jgi:hypothetical protein